MLPEHDVPLDDRLWRAMRARAQTSGRTRSPARDGRGFLLPARPGDEWRTPIMEIRRASRCDVSAAFYIRLSAIQHQCRTVYSEQQVHAWTSVPLTDWYADLVENHFHLACISGTPVATGMLDLETGELGAIFVLPEFMHRGIGKAIVDHLEQIGRNAGLAEIHLEATLNAVRFYQCCGFVGREPAIYHSPSGLQLPCMPMRKPLT